ncbi:sensor histidine kinase [Mycetocola spongiae]|uniref:sensor histidine kinase n=1 Tax=Mycetocola spongiae TaxID=2859226 RepID=UPI001CF0DECD|nr:ATP-binding protein [Mycetocola spongiae]UCR89993.1 histidine kinase [Mycetocola spongiae]
MEKHSTVIPARGPSRVALLFVQVGIVLICVLVTVVVALIVQERQIREVTTERVTQVAESLAALPTVREGILGEHPAQELRQIADLVAQAAGVDYVVITDDRGVRLTHPDPALIGGTVSTDHTRVLAGERFIGTEVGTIGPTLRAKIPVYAGDTVIGTASVGILESDLAEDMHEGVAGLLPWALAALVFGILAAAGVTAFIGRRLDRLESDARDLAVQRRLAEALGEQSHEFINRLHVIHGLLEEEESAEALDYIRTLVPVDSEVPVSAPGPHAMSVAGLSHLLERRARELSAHGGALHLEGLGSGEIVDEDELAIIANLVGNAVEAVPAGGWVRVELSRQGEGTLIIVSDSGPGIAPGERDRVFERGFSTKQPLERGDTALPRGIGLALIAAIIRRRAGRITVGEDAGGGARFEAWLPRVDPAQQRILGEHHDD